MIIEQLLLSIETVQLAKIDNFIRAELQRRAEYAVKFGVHAPLAPAKAKKRAPTSPA